MTLWSTDSQRDLASLTLKLTGWRGRVRQDRIVDTARKKGIYKDKNAASNFLRKLDSSEQFPLSSEFDEDGHKQFFRTDLKKEA